MLGIPAPAQASRVLVMDAAGDVHARQDPLVDRAPARERRMPRRPAAAAPRAAAEPRTPQILQSLLATGQIDQPTHDRALAAFKRARELARKLSGARAAALRGVLADLEGMAARGAVRADRLPALVETLERNNEWWSTGPLLSAGARVGFTGSGLVWQHYPGHGIQIQWLGTWGKANGLWGTDGQDTAFANLVAESVSLAGNRAGGIGFEYLFPFDGGNPPWVSGLAQGTALTALVRAGLRLKDTTWYDAARQAVGIFRVAAPEGVAQKTANGTHYLQYSFAPRLHILNGFIQSLNGLFDYAKILDDEEGRALFAAGRERAAYELPRYDTGGWSKYSEFTESSLHYHDVLRGFVASLCTRLERAQQDGDPFCHYAAEFTLDLTRDPVITFDASQGTLRARRPARVRFSIDKPGTVTLVITRGAFTHRAVVPVRSGPHSFGWRPPAAGSYAISISATDYAGNSSTVSSAATVRRRR
jgi:hypothetical protein